ncbi:hypothetical protein Tco_1296675 [Tanacetum coccineum]
MVRTGILGVGVSSATCWSGTDLELCPISKVQPPIPPSHDPHPLTPLSLSQCPLPLTPQPLSQCDRVIVSVTLDDREDQVDWDGSGLRPTYTCSPTIREYEVILVSGGSEALNSLSLRGETGVGLGKVGVCLMMVVFSYRLVAEAPMWYIIYLNTVTIMGFG